MGTLYAAPALPESDPDTVVVAVRAGHPRLIFTSDDLPRLRAVAKDDGGIFLKQIEDYLPACIPPINQNFTSDATDAQRQAFWKLPTVAFHHVLTGNARDLERASSFLKAFVDTEHWEVGDEEDSGMSAANVLTGVALAYDWLYDDLNPELRAAVREKLLLQARRMDYLGFGMRVGKFHYWQGDPLNNHRWHRDAGLTLAALAIAGECGGRENWIVSRALEELKFVNKWLPPDGTSHESSSYQSFGAIYLTLAFDAADRCVGTNLLGNSYFRRAPDFRLCTLTSGLGDVLQYGDCAGYGYFNNYLFRCTAINHLPNEQAGLLDLLKVKGNEPFSYGWMSLIWFDPTVGAGKITALPTARLFEDLGFASVRDTWDRGGVAMALKCGPYGGESLNRYRRETGHDINVAHDDPDANMFLLSIGDDIIADDDRYAKTKLTSSHNTLLVNGHGQLGEGSHWTQPIEGKDMSTLARMVNWVDGGDIVLAEGEAGGMYPDLTRFRRDLLWVKGKYVLILDDVRAEHLNRATWLLQAKGVQALGGANFELSNGTAKCGLAVVADSPLDSVVGTSTASHGDKSMGLWQAQLSISAANFNLAAILTPWKDHPTESITSPAPGEISVTVDGPGYSDVWTRGPSKGDREPQRIRCERNGKLIFSSRGAS